MCMYYLCVCSLLLIRVLPFLSNLMLNLSPEHYDELSHKDQSPSTLISRNVTVAGHRTSIRLEPDMWDALQDICARERSDMNQVCTLIAFQKKDERTSLTAAIRVFIMHYYRAAATEDDGE